MKLYLVNQQKNFKKHLDFLKGTRVMPYDGSVLREKVTGIHINTNKPFEELDLDFFFNYEIFPDTIMSFKTQWQDEKRNMQVGDTIVQQVYIPPIKKISQKLIFGVRINEIITKKDRLGFSYETLEGHVEKGVSLFILEKKQDAIIFNIQTFSAGGNFLSRLLGPVFSTPYQTFCTKKALKHVKKQLEKQ
jgi:uncharacterized protein (UPF0548 family)